MNVFRVLFLPPKVEGYELNMKVKFLHIALWVGFFAMVIFGYLNIGLAAPMLSQAMFITAGICLIGLYLNAIKKFIIAASIFTTVIMGINFYNLYDGISLHDAGIVAFPIIVIFAGFLFGKKSIYPITVINLASIFLLVYFEKAGVINPPTTTGDTRVIIISVLLVASAILFRTIMGNWDITLGRARSSENKIREALEEMSKIRDELEVRVQERTVDLQMAFEELEAFSYSVSHDLRAPLRAINGFISILNDEYKDKLDEKGRGYIDRVRASSLRMNELIDDMLLLSQVGRRDIISRDIDIGSLAEDIFSKLAEQEMGREIEFNMKGCPNVEADRNLTEILLTNLLSNSIKFTRDKHIAKIELGYFDEDGDPIFFIKDNGIGFDMEFSDKVFSPFQRLHSQAEYGGTGIGLAIVQRIIQRHKGRVWLESEVNKGTTVYFTLGN